MKTEIGGSGMVLLTITFVVLKALGYLDWSWLWVFAPLWISAALFLVTVTLVGGVMLIVYLIEN